jgi:hypothetical protein
MSEDVRTRMHAIQENEIEQLHELTAFLDLEMHFVAQYAEVLTSVKAEWCHECVVFGRLNMVEPLKVDTNRPVVRKSELPRGEGPVHVFSRTPAGGKPSGHPQTDGDLSSAEDSEGESVSRPASSRKSSFVRRKSGSTSKETSRPSSRSSRKRSESASAVEKDKDKGEKLSRRLTVAEWASSAVGSVTKKSKGKFVALTSSGNGEKLSEDEGAGSMMQSFTPRNSKSRSKDNLGAASPKIPGRILKPPTPLGQDKKVVRALHDFAGSSEELSFKTGDEILVVNEVLDEWWMGELDGRKGLFPTVYTEIIEPPSAGKVAKSGAYAAGKKASGGEESDGSSTSSSLEELDGPKSSDVEGELLFSGSHLVPARSPFYGHPDTASITSSEEQEEGDKPIPPKVVLSPSLTRTGQEPHSAPSPSKRPLTIETAVKKPPPPPPPRRPRGESLMGSPPLPERRPNAFRSKSSPLMPAAPMLTPTSQDYETSPFESAVDLTGTGCGDFQQNPFKQRGMCNNCFTLHG